MSEEEDASSAMRQRLMTAEEVYVYKIPPMKNAGGHRAEDWNLAAPLKTCNLLVERRGDTLALEFQVEGQQFALAQLDVTKGGKVKSFLEQVVDSSRYFVVKIQGQGNREALIGFGFRDRDAATDLRESLQHYEKSLQRQENAQSLTGSFSIPKFEEGEQIHVNVGGNGKKSTSVRNKKEKKSGGGSGGGLLLKKPPPPAAEEDGPPAATAAAAAAPTAAKEKPNSKTIAKMAISMGDIDLDAEHDASGGVAGDDDSGSGAAVYEGDEEQWKTEFDMK